MARTKGMLNLSGNLEVNAQAPLDARTIVPTEADLTVANNFPYPYVGLEVYVTGTGKKFRLVNLDTTQSSSWQEIGEGGGGSGLPSGGTAGQYLVKQSATEGDADWQSLSAFTGATSEAAGAAGLVPAPAIGDEGKVLFGDGSWGNIVMPSVDYSQQSVEANIFDTTEKVIGQWIDGKLLYQKTITDTMPNASVMGTVVEKEIQHGISNIEKIVNAFGFQGSSVNIATDYISPSDLAVYPLAIHANATKLWIRNSNVYWNGNSAYVTLRYTKTTDSPLASDEKFAGLTASGEVIYKKHLSVPVIPSGQDNTVNIGLTSPYTILRIEGYGTRTSQYGAPYQWTWGKQQILGEGFKGAHTTVGTCDGYITMQSDKLLTYYITSNESGNAPTALTNVELDIYYIKS